MRNYIKSIKKQAKPKSIFATILLKFIRREKNGNF